MCSNSRAPRATASGRAGCAGESAGRVHARWAGGYRRRVNQLACRPLGTVAGIATLAMGGEGKSPASQMYSHERLSGTDLVGCQKSACAVSCGYDQCQP
jgi:hypothetical protein